MTTQIIQLGESNLREIMNVEQRAFIPPIQTTEENIKQRLRMGHVYFGALVDGKLVGTFACRRGVFNPDFEDFMKRYPNFEEYADQPETGDKNAMIGYSLGVIPRNRNAQVSKKLLLTAIEFGLSSGLDFLVGDGRIPSFNGSSEYPEFEKYEKDPALREAVDTHFRGGSLPSREIFERDPITGFYLRALPKLKVLGVTPSSFWPGDMPCGGHMVILYQKIK